MMNKETSNEEITPLFKWQGIKLFLDNPPPTNLMRVKELQKKLKFWTVDLEILIMTCHDTPRTSYEIDLEEITNSSTMLDTIFQVFKKSWNTPEITHEMLELLDALFSPQANLCPFGENKSIKSIKELLHE